MTEIDDAYFEPKSVSESLFKDKGSKHFGYVFPIHSADEIELHLNQLKKTHHNARHVCYAWSLGIENIETKYSDDGEPHNSAGPPIMGQIQSYNLSNTLIAVVRYFGGTKLGVGGLIHAYKTAAKEAIENGKILTKYKTITLRLFFSYELMSDVMRISKMEGVEVLSQKFTTDCLLDISVRLKYYSSILENLTKLHPIKFKEI